MARFTAPPSLALAPLAVFALALLTMFGGVADSHRGSAATVTAVDCDGCDAIHTEILPQPGIIPNGVVVTIAVDQPGDGVCTTWFENCRVFFPCDHLFQVSIDLEESAEAGVRACKNGSTIGTWYSGTGEAIFDEELECDSAKFGSLTLKRTDTGEAFKEWRFYCSTCQQ